MIKVLKANNFCHGPVNAREKNALRAYKIEKSIKKGRGLQPPQRFAEE